MINWKNGDNQGLLQSRMKIALGWNRNPEQKASDFDLDISAFLLDKNKKMISESHFVFYNNTRSPDGCIIHSGDNRTGEGSGDDEHLLIDLSLAESGLREILIFVSIHQGKERGQNFGMITDAYLRVLDQSSSELLRISLSEDFSSDYAVEVVTIKHTGENWDFRRTGKAINKMLEDYILEFK